MLSQYFTLLTAVLLSWMGFVAVKAIQVPVDDEVVPHMMEPMTMVQTKEPDWPTTIAHAAIVSGSTGHCYHQLCHDCQGVDFLDRKEQDGSDNACERGLVNAQANYYRREPYAVTTLIGYKDCCKSHALKLIHPVKKTLNVQQITRPADGAKDLFSISTDYTLETHGYQWVYVKMDHSDASTYRTKINELVKLIVDKYEPEDPSTTGDELITEQMNAQVKHVHDLLFPAMKKIIAQASGCQSVRLLDNLRYVIRTGKTKTPGKVGTETDELIRVRAGRGHQEESLLEGRQRWDPHEGIPDPEWESAQEKETKATNFRFPDNGGDKGAPVTQKELTEEEQRLALLKQKEDEERRILEEALKKVEKEEAIVMKKEEVLEVKERDRVENEDEDEDDPDIPEAPAIVMDSAIEIALEGPGQIDEKKLEEEERTHEDGPQHLIAEHEARWLDVAGGCKTKAGTLPVLHVDHWHATELDVIRNSAQGKEVHFRSKFKKQNPAIIYREMYNVWIWLGDHYCSQPLGFDARANDGMKHINTHNGVQTSTVVHSEMKKGDFVIFRTHDTVHSALKISDRDGACTALFNDDDLGDCRMSVEIRVFGYGTDTQCKGVL